MKIRKFSLVVFKNISYLENLYARANSSIG